MQLQFINHRPPVTALLQSYLFIFILFIYTCIIHNIYKLDISGTTVWGPSVCKQVPDCTYPPHPSSSAQAADVVLGAALIAAEPRQTERVVTPPPILTIPAQRARLLSLRLTRLLSCVPLSTHLLEEVTERRGGGRRKDGGSFVWSCVAAFYPAELLVSVWLTLVREQQVWLWGSKMYRIYTLILNQFNYIYLICVFDCVKYMYLLITPYIC